MYIRLMRDVSDQHLDPSTHMCSNFCCLKLQVFSHSVKLCRVHCVVLFKSLFLAVCLFFGFFFLFFFWFFFVFVFGFVFCFFCLVFFFFFVCCCFVCIARRLYHFVIDVVM